MNTRTAYLRPRNAALSISPWQIASKGYVAFLYLLSIIVYAIFFYFWQIEAVPWHIHLAAVVVFAICLFPLFRWYMRNQDGLPIFELIAISYALHFSVPVFTQPNSLELLGRFVPIAWEDVFTSLLLVALGVLVLSLGFYFIQKNPIMQLMPKVELCFTPLQRNQYLKWAIVGGGLFVLLNLLTSSLQSISSIGAIVLLLTNQLNMAIILLAFAVYGKRERHLVTLLYSVVGFEFVTGMLGGMLENALMPLILLFVSRWQADRRIPWRLLLVAGILIVVLNPVKSAYRSQVWFVGSNINPLQQVQLWVDLATDSAASFVSSDLGEERQSNLRNTMARFDLLHKFAHVQRMTPAIVPYYGGETYTYFLVAWIPRFLWPTKPIASTALHRLDVDYYLKLDFQRSTNIGIGLLPEAYANFGSLGVVFIMLVQGIIFGFLNRLLNGSQSEGGRMIYLSLLAYFLNGIGSTAVVLFGALLPHVLANVLILRLFTGSFQAPKIQESALLANNPENVGNFEVNGNKPRHLGARKLKNSTRKLDNEM